MPSDERPRERLLKHGASVLSTAELLAILMRSGTKDMSVLVVAAELLRAYDGLRGVACASIQQLSKIRGVGEVKAIEIHAAFELGRRLAAVSQEERPTVKSPRDIANLLMPEMRDLQKEHLKSILLDTKNRVIRITTVSIGTLDSSLVHPREVYKEAIASSAASLALIHNHPSGDPTPSKPDIEVTERIMEAGEILGISLVDHIIIGDNCWVSLKEKGYL